MGSWHEVRPYQHFDNLCSPEFLNQCFDGNFVAKHSWFPLIHFSKGTKRYKCDIGKTVVKQREIMYASHRDAALYGKYADCLNAALEDFYVKNGLSDAVIAYRRLKKANYHFAAEVETFVRSKLPCCVMCFDVHQFFDSLDHGYLKEKLKCLLAADELSPDWYAVFKALTRFSWINKDDLNAIPAFAAVIEAGFPKKIAGIDEIKRAGVPIYKNPNRFGIPQGTPLSAAVSNAYMMEIDQRLQKHVDRVGGLYRRYSDDIILVVPIECKEDAQALLMEQIKFARLSLNADKTEINIARCGEEIRYQYLGFDVDGRGACIRGSSLSRQGRKFAYGIKRIRKDGKQAIALGKSSKIFTKRLRFRFVDTQKRNFSNYSMRAARVLGSKRLRRQVVRLERRADGQIRDLKL